MDKIASKLQNHYDILDFLCKNYPSVLNEWSRSNGPNHKATTGYQTDLAEGEDNAT